MTRYLFIFMMLSFARCAQAPDLELEKQKLLQLHRDAETAHKQKNAALFVGQFSDSILMVNRGKVTSNSREATLGRVQSYFDAVEFKAWDDLTPPRIFFSDDGSMAYMIVDKSVVLTTRNDSGQPVEESTHFAWVSIFKKQPDGQWKVVCNASTNEPAVEKILPEGN